MEIPDRIKNKAHKHMQKTYKLLICLRKGA